MPLSLPAIDLNSTSDAQGLGSLFWGWADDVWPEEPYTVGSSCLPYRSLGPSETSPCASAAMCHVHVPCSYLASYFPVCTPGHSELFAVPREWQALFWMWLLLFLEHHLPSSASSFPACPLSLSLVSLHLPRLACSPPPCFFHLGMHHTVNMEIAYLPTSRSTESPWRACLTHVCIPRKQSRLRMRPRVDVYRWRNKCSNDGDETSSSIWRHSYTISF